MNETKNKMSVTYSIDREIINAFDKFCPSGERSSTLNELLKEFLEKKGQINQDEKIVLAQKQLDAQRAMSEYESLKNRLEEKENTINRANENRAIEVVRQNYNASLNEESKAIARREVLLELGFEPYLERVPDSRIVEFTSKWIERHKIVLSRLLKELEVTKNGG